MSLVVCRLTRDLTHAQTVETRPFSLHGLRLPVNVPPLPSSPLTLSTLLSPLTSTFLTHPHTHHTPSYLFNAVLHNSNGCQQPENSLHGLRLHVPPLPSLPLILPTLPSHPHPSLSPHITFPPSPTPHTIIPLERCTSQQQRLLTT